LGQDATFYPETWEAESASGPRASGLHRARLRGLLRRRQPRGHGQHHTDGPLEPGAHPPERPRAPIDRGAEQPRPARAEPDEPHRQRAVAIAVRIEGGPQRDHAHHREYAAVRGTRLAEAERGMARVDHDEPE